jgi:hypothetical protein
MPAHATTATSVDLEVGDEWLIGVQVVDDDGTPTSATVAVAVTTPSGGSATPTAVEDGTGEYLARTTVAAAGRYVATVTVSGTVVAVVPFTAWAGAVTTAAAMPTVDELRDYLGDTSHDNDTLTAALAAEAAAQRARCTVPAVYPADLREALLRRVARNLAARSVPVASFSAFDGGVTSTRVPSSDPEVRRLEAPYRRMVVG